MIVTEKTSDCIILVKTGGRSFQSISACRSSERDAECAAGEEAVESKVNCGAILVSRSYKLLNGFRCC